MQELLITKKLLLQKLLMDLSFQEVNRLFVLSFEDNAIKKEHTGYFPRNVKVKDYDVMINGKNLFDQLKKKI